MPTFRLPFFVTVLCLLAGVASAKSAPFDLVTAHTKVSIVYAADDPPLDSLAAHLLAADIERVTGYLPRVLTTLAEAQGQVIVIGSINSGLIKSFKDKYFDQLMGKWECYGQKIINHPTGTIDKALVIAGSDLRGTAYGVFAMSEKIGVSPWYWWADVTPERKNELTVSVEPFTSAEPSVKYRGIFINDEDWGLQPWAAKTFETETNDIGPKTYAKVFELLLRLKANLIWPAMHPSTKPFYSHAGNKKVAADYDIIVGSSHAEPMLRNNVGEWDEKLFGHFNYLTNKDKVLGYWESRVQESRANKAIYTIGMRGVHDSGLEGVKSPQEAVPLLHQIFADQRNLLRQYINPDVTKVPQALTLYKEVLDIYENGLKVPEDVTLVWPDDNYGYLQRLNGPAENGRPGGAGVYYHVSYWGRPHDYLWLSTTHPALIREEMTKAYALNAKTIWVVNVGDIKPAEYNTQLFLDMAYNIAPFQNAAYSTTHLQNWLAGFFGREPARSLTKVLWQYYQLAFERKPEFMGWSQTEPTTPIQFTAYNHTAYGDQAQRRIDAYAQLQAAVQASRATILATRQAAFYELLEYPVMGAALLNKQYLYRDKAYLYAHQGRLSASEYAAQAGQAHAEIERTTTYYNTQLAQGKWSGIMSLTSRGLPVFKAPVFDLPRSPSPAQWQVLPEGTPLPDSTNAAQPRLALPTFDRWNRQRYFIDVYLQQATVLDYTVTSSASWLKVSQLNGHLEPQGLQSQQRLWVEIDWANAPAQQLQGSLTVAGSGRQFTIEVRANNAAVQELANYKGFVASAKMLAISAADFTSYKKAATSEWKIIEGLGSAGKALEAGPLQFSTPDLTDTTAIKQRAAVSYDFYTLAAAPANVQIYTLPTHPLNKSFELRYAVRLDGGPMQVLNFRTVGRSEEWKQNVLRNAAVRTMPLPSLPAGRHQLTLYAVDPGVLLDRILITLGPAAPAYGALPETVRNP